MISLVFLFLATVSGLRFPRVAARPFAPGRSRQPRAQIEFNDPDVLPTFASDELAATWERAGKGKKRWQPGDKTGDARMDYSLLYTSWKLTPLELHCYDACPFCMRARLVLGHVGLPFEVQFYAYGQGADPAACDGHGYDPLEGPVTLTGKKMLPVLTGAGVPSRSEASSSSESALPESLEICSFAAGVARDGRVAPATGRADVAAWLEAFLPVCRSLTLPRLVRLPLPDFASPSDVDYHKWKHAQGGFDYAEAEAASPALKEQVEALLLELDHLVRGQTREEAPCLNEWGFSMDDVLVLPHLRLLTCVAGVAWPPKVAAYLESASARGGMDLYTAEAC